MRWEDTIARIEAEALEAFPDGSRKNAQGYCASEAKNRLEFAAACVINGVTRLRKASKGRDVNSAIEKTVDLLSSYEEFWILAAVPAYKNRQMPTDYLLVDMNRGAAATARVAKAARNGAPRSQREKGKKTVDDLKYILADFDRQGIRKRDRAAKAAKRLRISPRRVRQLIKNLALR